MHCMPAHLGSGVVDTLLPHLREEPDVHTHTPTYVLPHCTLDYVTASRLGSSAQYVYTTVVDTWLRTELVYMCSTSLSYNFL